MANYVKDFTTSINLPEDVVISKEVREEIMSYNGKDLSYENANHCKTLYSLVEMLNKYNVPYFYMEYELTDELGMTYSVDYDFEKRKWFVYNPY